ncbi:MarR family winged helix-turn-helix transcriptional regulator [Dermacoccaceae bacterium W4C1]
MSQPSRDEDLEAILRELRVFTRRLNRRWTTTGSVSLAEVSVLATTLELQVPTVGSVSQALGLDKSTVSRQVTALVTRGFLEREPIEGESRAQRLTLTERGRSALERNDQQNAAAVRDRVQQWSDTDVRRLSELLRRFNTDGGD